MRLFNVAFLSRYCYARRQLPSDFSTDGDTVSLNSHMISHPIYLRVQIGVLVICFDVSWGLKTAQNNSGVERDNLANREYANGRSTRPSG